MSFGTQSNLPSRFVDQTGMITGAFDGPGEATVISLARENAELILTGRKRAALDKTISRVITARREEGL